MTYPRLPAAFINVIAEEGTKEEAIYYLQKEWDENCYLRNKLRERGYVVEQRTDNETKAPSPSSPTA